MTEEEYIQQRVDQQIDWYSKNSQQAKFRFKLFKILEIFSASCIPIIAGFGSGYVPVNLIVAFLGGLIAILSSVTSLNQYQERWIEYRNTCEAIKREKFLYFTKAEPYHEETPFRVFSLRIESLISKENSNWTQFTKSVVKTVKTN